MWKLQTVLPLPLVVPCVSPRVPADDRLPGLAVPPPLLQPRLQLSPPEATAPDPPDYEGVPLAADLPAPVQAAGAEVQEDLLKNLVEIEQKQFCDDALLIIPTIIIITPVPGPTHHGESFVDHSL